VAISEQTVKSESGGKTISDSNVVTTLNSTTNYEVSKTIQKVLREPGNQALTLAAGDKRSFKGSERRSGTKTVMDHVRRANERNLNKLSVRRLE